VKLEQLQELAGASLARVDQTILEAGEERCVIVVVLCGTEPGSPLAVASNVLPAYRAGLVKNLRAAAVACEGT
jgi:hypothetical protein